MLLVGVAASGSDLCIGCNCGLTPAAHPDFAFGLDVVSIKKELLVSSLKLAVEAK
jgi:hypothetical protein